MKKKSNIVSILIGLLKAIFGFLAEQKVETEEQQAVEAEKIEEILTEEYDKIDEEKEEVKQDEELDDVQDDLNNMF
jgi:hypothetical protein